MPGPSDPSRSSLPEGSARRVRRETESEPESTESVAWGAGEPWGEATSVEDEEEPRSLYLRLRASRSRWFRNG